MRIVISNSVRMLLALSLIVAMVFTYSFNYTYATTDTNYGYVNSSVGLNVRTGPSTKYSKVTTLNNNSKVNIYEEKFVSASSNSKSKIWLAINSSKNQYVRADYIDGVNYSVIKGITTVALNYRIGAGVGMKRVGTFKKGQEIDIVCEATTYDNHSWYKVKVGSSYYYVSAKYVKFDSASTTKVTEPVTEPVAEPVVEPVVEPVAEPVVATVDKNALITNATVNASYGLNIRKGPSVGTSKVGILKNNEAINIYEEKFVSDTSYSSNSIWLKIDNSSDKYVRADYVDNVTYNSTYGTLKTYLNYRMGAGTKMTKVGTLDKNKVVEIVAKAYSNSNELWYKIKYNNLYYYVSANFVNLNGGVTSEVTTEEPTVETTTPVMQEEEFEAFMTKEGFPESYKVKLRELHASNPSWIFYAQQISIPFENVIDKEAKSGTSSPSLIHSIYSESYKSVADGDYVFGKYSKTAVDGGTNGVFIYNNAEFNIVDETFTTATTAWAKVEFNGEIGYLNSSDIYDESYTTVEATANGITNVRKGASTSTDSIGKLALGDKVQIALTVTDSNGASWYKIKYNGSYAYVYGPNMDFDGITNKGSGKIDKGVYVSHDASCWFTADRSAVSYYMDPRNFLNTNDIYMFEDLSFHPEYQTEELVNKIIEGTQLSSNGFKASWFVEAGQTYQVSPVHLAARAKVETGGGTGVAISGGTFTYNGGTYSGIYNPYNIGASSSSNPVYKGLYWAATGTSYQRPWDDKKTSVIGGAQFISSGYINNNQNSIYTQKFNVANGLNNVATHQYMTNITAPLQEAAAVRNQYKDLGITDEALTFIIPVYQNMSTSTTEKPLAQGNNNCYMSMISVDGYEFTEAFDKDDTTYTVAKTLESSVDTINIKAYSNAKDAIVSGTGKIEVKSGKNELTIKVNSSSGKTKIYKIIVNKK